MTRLGQQNIEKDLLLLRPYLTGSTSIVSAGSFTPLKTHLGSTSWDGDAYSTAAKTLLDLSVAFGVPAGIKAILAEVAVMDVNAEGVDCSFRLSPNGTAYTGCVVRPVINNRYLSSNMIVPCDANGDVYYQIIASGTYSMAIYIVIWGYWT